MKTILQTILKPQMTRMNADGDSGKSPVAALYERRSMNETLGGHRPPLQLNASFLLSAFCFLFCLPPASAATRYVWQDSPSPAPPYDSWTNAATNIQDAVDAADPDDIVLVTNGVYATGGRAVYGTMTNRVAVDKPLNLLSVNGPEVTIIQGYQVPGTTNGDGAIRCVYLTNGASLSGFTLTNGATRGSGDVTLEQCGGGLLCESTNATVSNCTLTGNSASRYGGGDYSGTLNNCILNGNWGFRGGGATGGTLSNCTITGNSARDSRSGGGGVLGSTLYNCRLSGNSGANGGGAYSSTLNNCVLTGNSAWRTYGGGAYSGTLNNCTLTGNSAEIFGGGAYSATLNNCTLTGNSAYRAGGAFQCTLNNCIVYFNTAVEFYANYDTYCTLNYCCTTPLPGSGIGNISVDPKLADATHLSGQSPCIGAGSAAYATGKDFDGEVWANPPSIGCDEYYGGAVTGPLILGITATPTNVATGYPVELMALIEGRTTASVWEFGDGAAATNQPYTTHSWLLSGDYNVVLRAYNDTYPGGITATVTVHVATAPVHYVAADSSNPVSPYTSWATAATNIQDAVDAAGKLPGTQVLVSNGNYQPISVSKPLVVQSVSGPQSAVINGGNTNRCASLAGGVQLTGFTLTAGGVFCDSSTPVVSNCVIVGTPFVFAESEGAGAYRGTLINCLLATNLAMTRGGGAAYSKLVNCVLSGNAAKGTGGGAYDCLLVNCTISGNYAEDFGGGAAYSSLINCTLTHNSGAHASGAFFGTLNNCIVYYNDGGNYSSGTLDHSCTTPLPFVGVGNITNAPLFVNTNNWSNLRLQSNSPCINAGNNASVTSSTDLDGNPRIVSGTVDIGAYEYQGAGSVISYAWLQHYGLPTDGLADTFDADLDGHNAWQEWKCWTDPTNALSVLKLLPPQPDTNGTLVLWQSVLGQSYSVERATNASGPFSLLQGNIPGQAGTTSVTDTNSADGNPILYRVAVPE